MSDRVSRQRAILQGSKVAIPHRMSEGEWPHARSIVRWLGVAMVATVMGGCGVLSGGSEAPPQKEPVHLDIAIAADSDLNVDHKGRGAPMLLRVYELKSDVAFREADFFALQKNDKAVLGTDLLAVDQFVVRPGETRKIFRKSNPESTAIGFFAGYRDLPSATWRVVHKLPPEAEKSWFRVFRSARKLRLSVSLQKNAVVATDLDTASRPVQYANESLKELETAADDSASGGGEPNSKAVDSHSPLPLLRQLGRPDLSVSKPPIN